MAPASVHWLVAAALKYKPPDKPAAQRQPTVAELKAVFPNGAL